MTPIKFPESNTVFAEHQPEYQPLPCLRCENGQLLICWKLTLRERLKLLLTGKLWHTISTFNSPLQPQMLEVAKPQLNYQPEQEEPSESQKAAWEEQKRRAIQEHEENEHERRARYRIPIRGLDPAACLAALFNAAKPNAIAEALPEIPFETMTDEEARQILTDLYNTPGRNLYVDTIRGRVIRCHFGREFIRPQLYDAANGPDRAILALVALLPKAAVEEAGFPL